MNHRGEGEDEEDEETLSVMLAKEALTRVEQRDATHGSNPVSMQ